MDNAQFLDFEIKILGEKWKAKDTQCVLDIIIVFLWLYFKKLNIKKVIILSRTYSKL